MKLEHYQNLFKHQYSKQLTVLIIFDILVFFFIVSSEFVPVLLLVFMRHKLG